MNCATGEIHVWRIELACPPRIFDSLRATLSVQERRRAARFQSAKLREQWTIAHGALRSILAAYTPCEAATLAFTNGPNGKPALTNPTKDVIFNLCHTDELAMVAISATGRIGIDAEPVCSDTEVDTLARQYFTPGETAKLLTLPFAARRAAFFDCWTRKEAFIKALGAGLSMPLNRFEVTVLRNEPIRLLWADGENPSNWTFLDIGEPGTAAALVAEGTVSAVRRYDFVPKSDACSSHPKELPHLDP
jgi:4'-phosphopantetheinyl transferase